LSLTSSWAAQSLACAEGLQLMCLTCSSVVEVLVDELRGDSQPLCPMQWELCGLSANVRRWRTSQCRWKRAAGGPQRSFVQRRRRPWWDVAKKRWRELWCESVDEDKSFAELWENNAGWGCRGTALRRRMRLIPVSARASASRQPRTWRKVLANPFALTLPLPCKHFSRTLVYHLLSYRLMPDHEYLSIDLTHWSPSLPQYTPHHSCPNCARSIAWNGPLIFGPIRLRRYTTHRLMQQTLSPRWLLLQPFVVAKRGQGYTCHCVPPDQHSNFIDVKLQHLNIESIW